MLPDQIALLLEGIRHGLPIGQVPIEAANNQEPGVPTDFGRMTIAAIWRKDFFRIVLYDRHCRVSSRENGLAVKALVQSLAYFRRDFPGLLLIRELVSDGFSTSPPFYHLA